MVWVGPPWLLRTLNKKLATPAWSFDSGCTQVLSPSTL